jgi:hypothetical protein
VQVLMSFLEVPLTETVEMVWSTLDQAQRDEIVATLARLIAKTVEHDDMAKEVRDE